jgi:phosphoribosyl-AMP cyclohydrolase / phosphoribosyl-ATP pyrophosphohydrolase
MNLDINSIDSLAWDKSGGLIPAIVQEVRTDAVLMMGYVNRESLRASLQRERVVFFSRTRQQLWEKGETSGNTMHLVSAAADCDNDTLLFRVRAQGPACHRNTTTCFGSGQAPVPEGVGFLAQLEQVIDQRIAAQPDSSYTAKLYGQGLRRMAQKVGEEGVEVALAAQSGSDAELVSEAADLLFHLTLLLRARGASLTDVTRELAARHSTKSAAPTSSE